MPVFPQQGGSPGTWGTELRNFFSPFFNLTTGLIIQASIPGTALAADIQWTQIVKTGSALSDFTNHDHSLLTSIGTNNHIAIDAFIASKGATSGLASLDAASLVVQQPAVHTHTSTTTGGLVDHTVLTSIGTNPHTTIDAFIASKAATSGLASLNASSLVVQNPANASATPTANQIPILDASGNFKLSSTIVIASLTGTTGKTLISSSSTDTVIVGKSISDLSANVTFDGTDWRFIQTGSASIIRANYLTGTESVQVYVASTTGTAGSVISWSGPYKIHHDNNTGQWVNYSTSSTITGWNVPTQSIWYSVVNKICTVKYEITGTSNATTATFTVPFNSASGAGEYDYPIGRTQDNGTYQTTCGLLVLLSATNVVNLYLTGAGAPWTATGTKRVVGMFQYEMA